MARYLFFDFDGTLYDTVEGISKCVQYALHKRELDAELSELRCFAGRACWNTLTWSAALRRRGKGMPNGRSCAALWKPWAP